MNIEPADIMDIPALKKIASISIKESVHVSSDTLEDIVIDTHQHIDLYFDLHLDLNAAHANGVCLKMVCEQAIVGFIIIKKYWNLSDLFVLPALHGQGVGKALFSEALNICKRDGSADAIRVNSSLNAVDFYRKLGFTDFDSDQTWPEFVVPLQYLLG